MECKVCGAVIKPEYIYCKKCGSILAETGIPKDKVASWLKKRINAAEKIGTKQAYQQLMEQLNKNEFQHVEIQRSSVPDDMFCDIDEEDILHMVQELGNGNLKIICENSEIFGKLAIASVMNELDAIHNEIGLIKQSIHNNRIARIYTAFQQYQRAEQSEDPKERIECLRRAEDSCLMGINELRLEMKAHTKIFSDIPRSTLKKIFSCGVKLEDAKDSLNEMQESFHFYCNSVRLLMQMDFEKGETKRLVSTLQRERDFLKELQNLHGYKRLLEIDDVNAEKWEKMLRGLAADLYFVETYIGTGNMNLKILEEL